MPSLTETMKASSVMEALVRRESLEMVPQLLWQTPTDKVKELLSHGMMMLNISSMTSSISGERRSSGSREANGVSIVEPYSEDKGAEQEGGFDWSSIKKIPSPLEKSLTYLNAEEECASDSESLAR